ncbi:MAG: PAS domain-containing sensor histidine kinase [Kofleriaceae bacterium]
MTAPDLAPLVPALLDILNVVGTGILVVADRGNGLERWYANDPAAAIFGYTPGQLDDMPPLTMLATDQHDWVTQLSSGFRAGQPIPPAMELLGQHKDGRKIPIEITISAHRLPDGIAYVMAIRDVKSQSSLLEADRIGLVGALAAGFAHEINNPLTSVLLNLRSLRKQLTTLSDHVQPQARRCLDDITTGAERIASNVRALQTLATRSTSQSVDLAVVVSSALRLVAPTIEPRAHVIRQIFPVRPVLGEESRIGQAVIAMMLFSGSGFDTENTNTSNRIVVSVEERASDIVVEVSDNGRELTAEESRRAFDPFFRSSARGAGVGVGLGVARSVAITLGGGVTLASREGGGAVITMWLPAST